jgi:hypothetical protein
LKKFRLNYWKKLFPLFFALVYLPPKKDIENWQDIPEGASLSEFRTSSRFELIRLDWFKRSRFIFDGRSLVSFVETKKREWDMTISPSEKHFFWPSGAFSSISLKNQELNHFYVREHRNGFEAKFRAYQLAPDFEVVDFELCDSRHAFLLQKQIISKNPSYRLTLLTMLSSQELRRDNVWSFELSMDQDLLKLYPENCRRVGFEAWPQSLSVDLN